MTIQLRGVIFTLSGNLIAQFIGVWRTQVPAYPTIGPSFDLTVAYLYKELTGRDLILLATLIYHRDLTSFFRILHLIVVWDVVLRHHKTDFKFESGFFLLLVACRTPIDFPALILRHILRDARSESK